MAGPGARLPKAWAELADLPAGRQARRIMYFVYAIQSLSRNYIYVGLTNDLGRRLGQHNQGREITTRSYAPFRILLSEQFATRAEAREREKYLKSGSGKEYLKSL